MMATTRSREAGALELGENNSLLLWQFTAGPGNSEHSSQLPDGRLAGPAQASRSAGQFLSLMCLRLNSGHLSPL